LGGGWSVIYLLARLSCRFIVRRALPWGNGMSIEIAKLAKAYKCPEYRCVQLFTVICY
jgi:hypothetical protein